MSYIGQIPLPQATEERIERTATAGQTSFTGLTYVNGFISVYLNGVKLDNADFTATDGTTVTLGTGAAAGDTVSFVSTTQTSALVALPLKDSAGNAVLSESGGVVTLGNASVDETFSGMMEVDQWYLTDNVGAGDITTNWARNNFTGFSKIGTGLTESSGIFTFPKTGVYEIISAFIFEELTGGTDVHVGVFTNVSVDNGSTFNAVNVMEGKHQDNQFQSMSTSSYILNVNSISGGSTVQFKFVVNSLTSGNVINGNTSFMESNFTIKRLGPAQ